MTVEDGEIHRRNNEENPTLKRGWVFFEILQILRQGQIVCEFMMSDTYVV